MKRNVIAYLLHNLDDPNVVESTFEMMFADMSEIEIGIKRRTPALGPDIGRAANSRPGPVCALRERHA